MRYLGYAVKVDAKQIASRWHTSIRYLPDAGQVGRSRLGGDRSCDFEAGSEQTGHVILWHRRARPAAIPHYYAAAASRWTGMAKPCNINVCQIALHFGWERSGRGQGCLQTRGPVAATHQRNRGTPMYIAPSHVAVGDAHQQSRRTVYGMPTAMPQVSSGCHGLCA